MKESAAPNVDDINTRIAKRVRDLRTARGETLDALASNSGVSRSMISLIERAEASPTAVVLEKLAAGLGVSMARLFVPEPADEERRQLVRRADQAIWKDPESGYLRRNLSPPNWQTPIQLVEVHFPAQARVAYESSARRPAHEQQIWVLQGQIEVMLGNEHHWLRSGDCLALRLDRPLVYSNPSSQPAKYIVAICDEALAQLVKGSTT